MKIRELLEHHGILENPFADEDAQTDQVFKGQCIKSTHHPAWDKIYGSPHEPATAIVFGEKGSGKTALRMQMVRHLEEHNADHPSEKVFVVAYDDFNPFLDRFRATFPRGRKTPRVLNQWKIWDHMDGFLSLGVTQLVDRVLRNPRASHPAATDTEPLAVDRLSESQKRDLLLLQICYDQSTSDSPEARFEMVRRRLRFNTWRAKWDIALGIGVTIAAFFAFLYFGGFSYLLSFWPYLVALAGWAPRLFRMARWWWQSRGVKRSTRALNHSASRLWKLFTRLPERALTDQPLPRGKTTDNRYALLRKLQHILETLGFSGAIVLVDRVDEPYVINGSAELMRLLIWPLLDNKLLKHEDLGFKLLLPAELGEFVDRESRDFHERARLDKQNLIRTLDWTGQSLWDLANARMLACAEEGRHPTVRALFDESIDDKRLLDAFAELKVPRHLFKFLYRALVTHVNTHSSETPVWQVSATTFESVLARYQRDREAFEKGTGVV